MAIKTVAQTDSGTLGMSDIELDALVTQVIIGVGTNPLDFYIALQEFGSDYFYGESEQYRQKLCTALSNHFPMKNSYWEKYKGTL